MELTIYSPEELETLAEEMNLFHPDCYRLALFISLVRAYPLATNGAEYYRENLAKWIEQEQESYFGEYETPAHFAQEYYENYWTDGRLPNWLVVDWHATWSHNLRHDFTEDLGHYWADIY